MLKSIASYIRAMRITATRYREKLQLSEEKYKDFREQNEEKAKMFRKLGGSHFLNSLGVQKLSCIEDMHLSETAQATESWERM